MVTEDVQPKWYDKTWLVVILCIFCFPIGLYALWKNQSIAQIWKILITIAVSLIVIVQLTNNSSKNVDPNANESTSSSNSEQIEKKIKVGEVLSTDYFDIIVNEVKTANSVQTGNQFADLKPETGIKYLIINATFKNTDDESRMLTNGSVWINYNGKQYELDKAETIMLEGWGLLLDQINPLTSKTTNLVYKLSSEIKGEAYWQPGRASESEKIYLGEIE